MGIRRLLSTAISGRRLGFIGLGRMGRPMASNLLNTSNPSSFYVYDRSPAAVAHFPAATIAESPSHLAANSDMIVTMLPTTESVRQMYIEDMWEEVERGGKFFVDASTIDVDAAREVCAKVTARGNVMVDAPVSGGVKGAENATLTFMVGASESDPPYQELFTLLSHMGKHVIPLQKPGNGQIAKLCNNMLLAIHMIGLSEALTLGRRLGLDPELLSSVINASTGKSWSSAVNNPVPGIVPEAPSARDYEGGFTTALMSKDLILAINGANRVGANVTLGAVACMLYNQLKAKPGFDAKDFSSVFKVLDAN